MAAMFIHAPRERSRSRGRSADDLLRQVRACDDPIAVGEDLELRAIGARESGDPIQDLASTTRVNEPRCPPTRSWQSVAELDGMEHQRGQPTVAELTLRGDRFEPHRVGGEPDR